MNANQDSAESSSTALVTSALTPEGLRGIFHAITGQQSSLYEIFPRRIIVGRTDLEEINKTITEKLRRYKLLADVGFHAVLAFENDRSLEYSSWPDLRDRFQTATADRTKSLVLRWDFLIHFEHATKPEHHCLTVRVANRPHPGHVLQMMLSKDPYDMEKMEVDPGSPMSCKIDFIDNILSRELLAIVSEWNKALRSPQLDLPILRKFYRHDDFLDAIATTTVPAFAVVLLAAGYYAYFRPHVGNHPASSQLVFEVGLAFFVSYFVIAVSRKFGSWLGDVINMQINRMFRFSVFEITNGDRDRQQELLSDSSNSLMKFAAAGITTIVWNVAAAVIAYHLTK